MHPAYSVIVFTTASGAGLGLIAWLALAGAFGLVPVERWFGLVAFGLAFVLLVGGLLSSTAHLGRPERAWRAFSQWRTSWLSREGVLAVATSILAGIFALAWVVLERADGPLLALALLLILGVLATLYATGMIYASLRTIRQWYQPLTAPLYVALGLASGAVLFNGLTQMFSLDGTWATWLAVASLGITLAVKAAYWRAIDAAPRPYTVEAATGLGHLGKVRPLEPPHTQPNFVMREMGYQIARKHAQELRTIAVVLAFLVPAAASLLTLLPGAIAGIGGAVAAIVAMAAGLIVERWLFFAEAQHVVTLYYGAHAA